MDAYDSYEAYGYGNDYGEVYSSRGNTYRGDRQTYRVIPVSKTTYERRDKATLIIVGKAVGCWVPNKMIHVDKSNTLWAFLEDERWWKLNESIEMHCERMTWPDMKEYLDFIKANEDRV
tara:strand:+ start:352 stop:708 length:357 start_codon:yes stop_codon:yes gene_type:complete